MLMASTGQTSTQLSQSVQVSGSTTATSSCIEMASTGQVSTHVSHPVQVSGSTTAGIDYLPLAESNTQHITIPTRPLAPEAMPPKAPLRPPHDGVDRCLGASCATENFGQPRPRFPPKAPCRLPAYWGVLPSQGHLTQNRPCRTPCFRPADARCPGRTLLLAFLALPERGFWTATLARMACRRPKFQIPDRESQVSVRLRRSAQ